MAAPIQLLAPEKQVAWLNQHIPHRVRGAIIGLPMTGAWLFPLVANAAAVRMDPVARHCINNSVWEGRHIALRWLIEFAGVYESNGIPVPTRNLRFPDTDMRIDRMAGGLVLDAMSKEAIPLARVYKGCSQASGHPTTDSDHPDISPLKLAEALQIIVEHLQRTIYNHTRLSLLDFTMRPQVS